MFFIILAFIELQRSPPLQALRKRQASDGLAALHAEARVTPRSDDYDGAAAHAAPHEMGLLVRPVLLIPPVPTIAPVAFSLKKASFDRYGTCRTSWGC